MTGDEGDFWRDVRPAMAERSKDKRARNREFAPMYLREQGVPFETCDNGVHLIVAGVADFWPGTGLWIVRETGRRGRGIRKLIEEIRHGHV